MIEFGQQTFEFFVAQDAIELRLIITGKQGPLDLNVVDFPLCSDPGQEDFKSGRLRSLAAGKRDLGQVALDERGILIKNDSGGWDFFDLMGQISEKERNETFRECLPLAIRPCVPMLAQGFPVE